MGVLWPSRGVPWPLYEEYALEPAIMIYLRYFNRLTVFQIAVNSWHLILVHGQVTIIFVVSVCLSVCLFVQSFSQPSLIRFGSN